VRCARWCARDLTLLLVKYRCLCVSGIEVGHQRRDVLCRRQPTVRIFANVTKAAGRDGDVERRKAVEWEREFDVCILCVCTIRYLCTACSYHGTPIAVLQLIRLDGLAA
jgi:hypothetical protein